MHKKHSTDARRGATHWSFVGAQRRLVRRTSRLLAALQDDDLAGRERVMAEYEAGLQDLAAAERGGVA